MLPQTRPTPGPTPQGFLSAIDLHDLLDRRSAAERSAAERSMPRRQPVPPEPARCRTVPVTTRDLLACRWTVPVLAALRSGPIRLGELHRCLPDASKKVLTQTLRRLEDSRLLYRRDLSDRIRHVEYHLMPSMRNEVSRLLDELDHWGAACERQALTPVPAEAVTEA
jgi:DNA-binding HxlR family transcriptional regulator